MSFHDDVRQRIIEEMLAINAGIVPINNMTVCRINDILAKLPVAEQIRAKRKFRKLWRKALKKRVSDSKMSRKRMQYLTHRYTNDARGKQLLVMLYHSDKVAEALKAVDSGEK